MAPTFSLTDISIRGRQTNGQVIVSGVPFRREKKKGRLIAGCYFLFPRARYTTKLARGVFFSVDKCFETGDDPRNFCDKEILKLWTPCLSTFYSVFSRSIWRRVWKLAPSCNFQNEFPRSHKTRGSHLKPFQFRSNALCALCLFCILIMFFYSWKQLLGYFSHFCDSVFGKC